MDNTSSATEKISASGPRRIVSVLRSSGVTLDAAGNIYGTTPQGGGSGRCGNGCGVAYKLTATSSSSWTYSTLHVFSGGADGSQPSPLVFYGDGDLFGTTLLGGGDFLGTVFEITPN